MLKELFLFTYYFLVLIVLIVYLLSIKHYGIKKTNKEIFKWSEKTKKNKKIQL